MKKKFTNYEIDNMLTILQDPNSFRYNRQLKLSQNDRQALRLNVMTFSNIHSVFEDGRREIIDAYINDGKTVDESDGTRKVKPEYLPEFQKEMVELLSVSTDVEIVPLSKEGIDKILATDISIPEEDAVLLFKDDEAEENVESESVENKAEESVEIVTGEVVN